MLIAQSNYHRMIILLVKILLSSLSLPVVRATCSNQMSDNACMGTKGCEWASPSGPCREAGLTTCAELSLTPGQCALRTDCSVGCDAVAPFSCDVDQGCAQCSQYTYETQCLKHQGCSWCVDSCTQSGQTTACLQCNTFHEQQSLCVSGGCEWYSWLLRGPDAMGEVTQCFPAAPVGDPILYCAQHTSPSSCNGDDLNACTVCHFDNPSYLGWFCSPSCQQLKLLFGGDEYDGGNTVGPTRSPTPQPSGSNGGESPLPTTKSTTVSMATTQLGTTATGTETGTVTGASITTPSSPSSAALSTSASASTDVSTNSDGLMMGDFTTTETAASSQTLLLAIGGVLVLIIVSLGVLAFLLLGRRRTRQRRERHAANMQVATVIGTGGTTSPGSTSPRRHRASRGNSRANSRGNIYARTSASTYGDNRRRSRKIDYSSIASVSSAGTAYAQVPSTQSSSVSSVGVAYANVVPDTLSDGYQLGELALNATPHAGYAQISDTNTASTLSNDGYAVGELALGGGEKDADYAVGELSVGVGGDVKKEYSEVQVEQADLVYHKPVPE